MPDRNKKPRLSVLDKWGYATSIFGPIREWNQ